MSCMSKARYAHIEIPAELVEYWYVCSPVCSREAAGFCQIVQLEIQHLIGTCSQWLQS